MKATEQYFPVMQFVFNFSISLKWKFAPVFILCTSLGEVVKYFISGIPGAGQTW